MNQESLTFGVVVCLLLGFFGLVDLLYPSILREGHTEFQARRAGLRAEEIALMF